MRYQFIIISLALFPVLLAGQSPAEINKTDGQGKKQGPWIKKYPHGVVQYEGTFRDNHPVGEFRRYYPDHTLMSVMIFSEDGNSADASLYYTDGYIASKGKYVNQLKEGKWKYFADSADSRLLSEDEYSGNNLNGPSVTYYSDGTIAERLAYIKGKKEGEWVRYFENGKIFLRSNYTKGSLNGKFEVWFENGRLHYSGAYKNSLKEGKWIIYKEDGNVKYEVNYVAGATNDKQLEKEMSDFIEKIEKDKDKITDPEKTGEFR